MKDTSDRLLSLDVFRGITIAFMILVNSPGSDVAYAQLDHAAWDGLTLTDLVFPFFVFIVGVSLVFSIRKRLQRGDTRAQIMGQVVKRTALIFALGLLLNGFPYYHLSTIRVPGVLQRIALCYGFGAFCFLYTPVALQMTAIVTLLAIYAWLMLHMAVPGFGVGNLSKEGNFAAYLDRLVLGAHLYRPVYDPEGLLSTLPAFATGLIGTVIGQWLRSGRTKSQKVIGLLPAAAVFLLMGWTWSYYFPINKALWTSSYVLVTAGLALLLLSACYAAIEIKGWRAWGSVFRIFGTNAIAAYFLHVFFLKVQNLWHRPRLDGTPGNIRIFVTEHFFQRVLSPVNASLAYALSYTLLWFAFLFWLDRRKIHIKI